MLPEYRIRPVRLTLLLGLLLFVLSPAVAATGGHGLEHRMSHLALQIGIILIAGYAGTRLAKVLHIPAILGEVVAGIIIGPYVLGSRGVLGFPHGVFPRISDGLSISPELYGFAVVASIVLLFLIGLQTDMHLFLRFAPRGSAVGLGGAVLSVSAGITVGVLLTGAPLSDPGVLFLGAVAIATSVDITGRILSERHRMASPEGVTILSASVIEDVMGITFLSIILSLESIGSAGSLGIRVVTIAGSAILIWLGFTTIGILFSNQISAVLKRVHRSSQIAVLALACALILAGVFEALGLAMIIGAYVMGLTLADTDIAYVVQEKIETVHHFFDPIFFTVVGMLINIHIIATGDVILFGLLFSVLAIGAKLIGCGGVAALAGFNRRGALRVGVGMIPRGEVALVIASIGLGSGILTDQTFGVTIVMTLITTLLAPPIFNRLLKQSGETTRTVVSNQDMETREFEFDSLDLTRFLVSDIISMIRSEGFFVNSAEGERRVFHIRKDRVFITMTVSEKGLQFTCHREDLTLVNSLVFESILALQQQVSHIRSAAQPEELRRTLVEERSRAMVDWPRYIPVECVHLNMRSASREEIIHELTTSLLHAGKIHNFDEVYDAVIQRERSMSTGMEHGVAIPHGRATAVTELCAAVGIVPEGVEFDALDGGLTHVVFLVVSPQDNPGPHLQILAGIAGIINSDRARQDLMEIPTRQAVISYLVAHSNRERKKQ